MSACKSNFQSRKYTSGIYFSFKKKKNQTTEQLSHPSKITKNSSITGPYFDLVLQPTEKIVLNDSLYNSNIIADCHQIEISKSANYSIPPSQIKSNSIISNKASLYCNHSELKIKRKNSGFDFFDSVIGFLYLVMFVIFTAMYFILLIATYASMPLIIALGLAMLLSLLTCITGQFIQV